MGIWLLVKTFFYLFFRERIFFGRRKCPLCKKRSSDDHSRCESHPMIYFYWTFPSFDTSISVFRMAKILFYLFYIFFFKYMNTIKLKQNIGLFHNVLQVFKSIWNQLTWLVIVFGVWAWVIFDWGLKTGTTGLAKIDKIFFYNLL